MKVRLPFDREIQTYSRTFSANTLASNHKVSLVNNHEVDVNPPSSYLELALDGARLDKDTRENLIRSHAASKVCHFPRSSL